MLIYYVGSSYNIGMSSYRRHVVIVVMAAYGLVNKGINRQIMPH